MSLKPLLLCLILACGAGLPATAQPVPATITTDDLLRLAQTPWMDRAGFLDHLGETVQGFRADEPRLDTGLVPGDPYLWSITGGFGAPRDGSALPGGIVACSRYGLATRDRLAATDLTDPVAFRLLGATMAARDDSDVWPEGAVARMVCMLTWDDAARVAIIPAPDARAGLEARFARVDQSGDREYYGADWQDYAPIFGADGYRLIARGGPRTTVYQIESVEMELRVTHQRLGFRAFLMGGGA